MKIIKAKKVYQVNEAFTTANAIVVDQEKIVATGEFEELKAAYPHATIDLTDEDNIIYPGFIEPHTHLMGGVLPGGMIMVDVIDWEVEGKLYTATKTKEEIYSRIWEEIKANPEKKCHFALGLYEPIHGKVDVEALNAQNFGVPVVLGTNSTHVWYFNDEAIELMGADFIAAIPEGTYGLEVKEDGTFSGVLKEVAVQIGLGVLFKNLLSPEVFKAGINFQYESNMKKGITTIVDMAWGLGGPLDGQSLDAMANFPQRIGVVNHWIGKAKQVYDENLTAEENRSRIFNEISNDFKTNGFEQNNKRFTTKGVKFFADGAIIDLEVINSVPDLISNKTPEWNHDYRTKNTNHGLDTMLADMEEFFVNDFMVHVHTQGDKANEMMLEMFTELQAKHGKQHNKMSLEHFAFSNDRVFELMDTENSLYVSGLPHYGYYFYESWLKSGHVPAEIVKSLSSYKKVIEAGGTLSLHSDFMNFPTDPLACLYFATNKISSESGEEYNDQAISMQDALKGITINAAKNNQLDQYIGSIEAGKLADFTVLAVDLFDMNQVDLMKTNAKAIYVGGNRIENNLK